MRWSLLAQPAGTAGARRYNAVNGLPTCANPAMNHTLRGDWGFGDHLNIDYAPTRWP